MVTSDTRVPRFEYRKLLITISNCNLKRQGRDCSSKKQKCPMIDTLYRLSYCATATIHPKYFLTILTFSKLLQSQIRGLVAQNLQSAIDQNRFKVASTTLSKDDASTAVTVVDTTGAIFKVYWFWYCPRFYYNNCCNCWNYWNWWRRCWFSYYIPY